MSDLVALPKRRIKPRILREERANCITHGIGLALSIAGVAGLLAAATEHCGMWLIAGCGIYGFTLIAVYAASTLSHAIHTPEIKQHVRAWDQGLIYLLIAGSYTPFALVYLAHGWWWLLLEVIWVGAIIGFFAKVVLRHRIESVSITACMLLGWIPALAIQPILHFLPTPGLFLMFMGGVCFSIGAVFLIADRKVPYAHAIWHVFVIAGHSCQYVLTLLYVVG
jgi:hemolysin III